MKTKTIKELGIKITKPIIWTKPYNEIVRPKDWRLPHMWELPQIHESKHKSFIFGEKGILNFWCEQLTVDKGNKRSRWLYRDWDDDLNAGVGSLWDANDVGRVCFVKELEE